jgi:hypothetical protein
VATEPCAYWSFDYDIFNPPVPNPSKVPIPQFVSVLNDKGDRCHGNLHNVSDDRLKKVFKRQTEDALRICADGISEPFTADRVIDLCNQHYPDPT